MTRHDELGPRHRASRFRRRVFTALFLLIAAAGAAGMLLWSPLAAVTDISVAGAGGSDADAIRTALDAELDDRRLGLVPVRRSIVLVNESAVERAVTSAVPVVQTASVSTDWPHTLTVAVTLRTPRGMWCPASREASQDTHCEFWDESGARWGETGPSIGLILLQVRDARSSEASAEEEARLLSGILTAVNGIEPLGLRAKLVTLPDAEPGGIRITLASGYDLVFDAYGDMPDQLSTLAVLLADKAKDPAFRPQYIDLRTPGRVYYK